MKRKITLRRSIPLMVALSFGLLLFLLLYVADDFTRPQSPLLGEPLPAFTLPRLDNPQALLLPTTWSGRPAIINVFASWCQPCRVEHPLLMQLAHAQRIELYGIGWQDTAQNIAAYLQQYGNPFQAIGVDTARVTTVPLGILGVPTTYLVDAKGVVRWKLDAPLDAARMQELQSLITQLLQEAQAPHVAP